ncbi:hypothetical protein NDN01_23820 [Sphingomonas sp. QA11]|uniref:hypothetical protein n=1 Tax=Sphingomonas sp. QA11 TaxID=2950605 RepID=UPI002349F1BF|nr:hypothetical protein [Sphingomonas sp. QA11]WCM26975.1 hypothetical protein NDN01_23820 [Sphingomonas sp. QA11]
MSLPDALKFIRAARTDADLRARIAALPADADADALCTCTADFAFSGDELAEAFRIDWTARWAHYSRRG